MNYVLTVLTNGRQVCFERSVHAFMQHVQPAPAAIYVFDDGGQTGGDFVQKTVGEAFASTQDHRPAGHPTVYNRSQAALGMCAAHKYCHDFAAESGFDWAFHLEDDFVILRPADLVAMQHVLCVETHLAQMALVRAPWGREIEHGGYIPNMPGYYERRGLHRYEEDAKPSAEFVADVERPVYEWIETTRNWATNPALMRTALLREFPWSPEPGCETEIGPRILAAYPEMKFGLWGWGEPWAAHIALERQPGAYGY